MMGEYYINLVSLTYAYKAKNLLSTHGIASRVVHTPKTASSRGCGYSLAVAGDIGFVYDILRLNGITVLND